MPNKVTPEIKGKVDAVVQGAFKSKGFKTLEEARNALANEIQGGMAYNEYLNAIKNQIARIATVNFIKVDVPILKHFWHSDLGKIGDYLLQRQIMNARYTEYSEIFDGNDHYNAEVLEQVAETVFRDRYDISISQDIVSAAFNSYGDMNSFIDIYMGAIQRTVTINWNNRQLDLFSTIPVVYKMTNDDTKGVAVAKEIWQLITKMGMVSNKFNVAGIPQYTSTNEMIIILNSKYSQAIQFDAVGSLLNYNSIANGGKIKDIYTYDFPDTDTIGVILTENSFWLDRRIDENTYQSYARTLIQDNYYHLWVRAMRNDFVNMVRIVAPTATLPDKIDYTKSPLTHKNASGVLVKDEPTIIDVTSFVTGGTLDKLEVNTDLRTHLPKGSFTVTAAATTPTADEIKTALKELDYRFEGANVDITGITTSGAVITAKKPYVVNSFTDSLNLKYTVSVSSGSGNGSN